VTIHTTERKLVRVLSGKGVLPFIALIIHSNGSEVAIHFRNQIEIAEFIGQIKEGLKGLERR